jgi:hypothetical protein
MSIPVSLLLHSTPMSGCNENIAKCFPSGSSSSSDAWKEF